jgi:hypothetical protein
MSQNGWVETYEVRGAAVLTLSDPKRPLANVRFEVFKREALHSLRRTFEIKRGTLSATSQVQAVCDPYCQGGNSFDSIFEELSSSSPTSQ